MRKRSKYKPKKVIPDVMSWLTSGMMRVADTGGGTIITQTRIKNHLAIESLRQGEATKDDIDVLISAFNVCEALAIMKIGEEYRDEIRAGQDAIYSLGMRAVSKGKFICTGPELVAINLTMEIHDAQLDICTVTEMERALDFVWKEISMKRARTVPAPKGMQGSV